MPFSKMKGILISQIKFAAICIGEPTDDKESAELAKLGAAQLVEEAQMSVAAMQIKQQIATLELFEDVMEETQEQRRAAAGFRGKKKFIN